MGAPRSSLMADAVQADPETMGYVRRSGYTFAQLTHKLWSLFQQPVGETSISLELIDKFPPKVLGVLEEALEPVIGDDCFGYLGFIHYPLSGDFGLDRY